MQPGTIALIVTVILVPIYSILIAVFFFKCLRLNPFVEEKKQQPVQQAKKKEESVDPLTKGDKADFAEAQVIKENIKN